MSSGTEGDQISIILEDEDGDPIPNLDAVGTTITATITLTDLTTEDRTCTLIDAATAEITYTVSATMAAQGWVDEDITIDPGDGTLLTSIDDMVDKVIKRSGVANTDLDQDNNDYYDSISNIITNWTEWLQVELNDSELEISGGLEEILLDICSKTVSIIEQNQSTSIMDNENFKVAEFAATVITADIERRLKPYNPIHPRLQHP